MKKQDELINPESCFNHARIDERLFVLLARDIAAPATIRFWVNERLRLGKNQPEDRQISDALRCAELMEEKSSFPGLT